VEAESVKEEAPTSTPEDPGLPALPNKDLNRRVALLSTLGAVALFASQRLNLSEASLKDLAANAVPYEEVSIFVLDVACVPGENTRVDILELYYVLCLFS
jgi:hypothetical protein